MRWNFGGNLQPVRTICEYDWKECPVALMRYVWSEVVTDVVDGLTTETNLWRILLFAALCSMLFHAFYRKTKWLSNDREENFSRDHLIKVGFKVRDLELKINILTYKMQYGTWPLPHEISTPSLNDLKNVKLTLSNTSKRSMWTKQDLRDYISKCIENLETDKFLPSNQSTDLKIRNEHSKDYDRLVTTAKECRRYMDEINRSNKNLGLCDNSSDVSDQNTCAGTESEENGRRCSLTNEKKWQEIYKSRNNKIYEDVSGSDFTSSNQMFSTDDERYPLKTSKNKVRLLPPGLSITFLSDKFKNFHSTERCEKIKICTNDTLNKAKDKLEESLLKVDNSKSLNIVKGISKAKTHNFNIDKSTYSDCETSSGDFNFKGVDIFSRNQSKDADNCFSDVVRTKTSLDFKESPNVTENLWNKRDDVNFPIKSLTKLSGKEDRLYLESDSSTSFEGRSARFNDSDKKSVEFSNKKEKENCNLIDNESKIIETPMETREDEVVLSETPSPTELSKDSETDDKSTTTLLREALEFKKTLLMQIKNDNEIRDEERSSEYESDETETQKSKLANNFRSKILDIICEEQSAGSSTEKTSKTYLLSRGNNGNNINDETCRKYFNKNNNSDDLKSDKIPSTDNKFKGLVNASSSEYFSLHNVAENEHTLAPNEEQELNEARNRMNNDLTQGFDTTARIAEMGEAVELDDGLNSSSLDIEKRETSLVNESSKDLEDVTVCAGAVNNNKYYENLSCVNSDKGITWNSISESSSIESITEFVKALVKRESKTIDLIAQEKLMMLNSTDYEGRNFATAGEDLKYCFDSCNCKTITNKNTSEEHNNRVIEEVMEMIADSAIFKSEKIQTDDEKSSSSLFESDKMKDKLYREKMQRKQDIFSKLKTLDAFTKPLDICESNSEKIDNEEDEESPRTGRTVVRNYGAEDKNETRENLKETEDSIAATDVGNEFDSSINVIDNCKKKQLSISSTTNFSTDTSESYFDVSNHDFAVSSIILTSENSNFLSNVKENCLTSNASSSSYVDAASDYSSKIFDDSSSRSQIKLKNIETDVRRDFKPEPVLVPKCTSSLPENDKKVKACGQGETLSNASFNNKENFRCWSNFNLEKSYSKGKTMLSRSCIPVLKSRIDPVPRRDKSIETKARSNTPTNQTGASPSFDEERRSLNRKESYVLPQKSIDDQEEFPKPIAGDKEYKIERSIGEINETKLLDAEGNLTEECTVIYINIVSDSERDDGESKETTNRSNSCRGDDNLDSQHSDSSARNPDPDEKCETNLSPSLESKEDEELSKGLEIISEISASTANKLLSTSTLEISNIKRTEKREIEVSAKPSVKNTSTSISDFVDVTEDKQKSFYNPTKEVFDLSKDFVKNDKILLSEMLTMDSNFFECKKSHKLYNKLGLGFQEQQEQS